MQLQSALTAAALSASLAACGTGAQKTQTFRSSPGAAAYRQPQQQRQTADLETVDRVLLNWPRSSEQAARATIARYRLPNEVTASMLIWHDNYPFVRTVVRAAELPHDFPSPHYDVLEQTVSYRVPADKVGELLAYDGSLVIDRTAGELTARGNREEMNLLALNLADQIATSQRSPEQARALCAELAAAFAKGEPSAYTQQLLFDPQARAHAADLGKPLFEQRIEQRPTGLGQMLGASER